MTAIREHADATDEERAITLCNSGVMAFDAGLLRDLLPRIGNDNAKGEYYLTDMVGLASDAGEKVALATCPEREVQGVNTRARTGAGGSGVSTPLPGKGNGARRDADCAGDRFPERRHGHWLAM